MMVDIRCFGKSIGGHDKQYDRVDQSEPGSVTMNVVGCMSTNHRINFCLPSVIHLSEIVKLAQNFRACTLTSLQVGN